MSFFGNSFVFDGKPSQVYNIFITNMEGGENTSSGSSNVSLKTNSIFRRSVPYFYGSTQDTVLSFRCAVTSPEEILADESRAIQRWLFGHSQYKKLQIVQNDMEMFYYNCFLTEPETLRIGNQIHGFSFTVVCDAPWAWAYEKSSTKTYAVELASESYTFQNTSDDNDYLYPDFVITMNAFGGYLSLTNNSDNGRIFLIEDLAAGEVLTIDNSRGILTSSTGLRRLSSFNKNWFRLVSGRNNLVLLGNISSLVMSYKTARKVG